MSTNTVLNTIINAVNECGLFFLDIFPIPKKPLKFFVLPYYYFSTHTNYTIQTYQIYVDPYIKLHLLNKMLST
jgi:hypothetical protein